MIFLFSEFAAAEDRRTVPVTLYLIIDGSEGLKSGQENALIWIDDYIDRVLQDGDNLTVWLAAEKATVLFSETLSGAAQKETLRELFRSITPRGDVVDYAGALREAAARETRRLGSDIPYTLLITGVAGGFFGGKTSAEFLRYSRILEFPGWRVQMVGLGLASRVQKAASGYMMGG